MFKKFLDILIINQFVCSDSYKNLGSLLTVKNNNKLEWFK